MSNVDSKKIVIVGPAYPLRGGIANFNEALALALQKAGHQVDLFSFYYQYPSFLFPGKSQYDNTEMAPQDLRIHNSISSINPISWSKTAKQISTLDPDVVVVRFWLPFMGPSLGSIAKKLRKKGVKVIAITDNVIPHEKRIGDRPLTNYFLKNCDGFVTMSNSVLKDIEQFTDNPNKVMLPHPLYDTFGNSSTRQEGIKELGLPNDETNYLLFFGLIRGYKGLDIALKAFADKRVVDLGIKLIVAGEFYDKKDRYIVIIKELGIEQSVIIHDHYIPTERVKYYFAVSDAVIQPYKTATQSGITQVAYHFNMPMLVSNVGGLPEIVPDGVAGYVCEPIPYSFSEGIIKLYADDNLSSLVNGVKEEKKKYEWSYFVENLIAFSETIG